MTGEYYLVHGPSDTVVDGPFEVSAAAEVVKNVDEDHITSHRRTLERLESQGVDITWHAGGDADAELDDAIRTDGGSVTHREDPFSTGDEVLTLECECGRHPKVVKESRGRHRVVVHLGCGCGAKGRLVDTISLGEEVVKGPLEEVVKLSGSFEEFVADERGQGDLLSLTDKVTLALSYLSLLLFIFAFGGLVIYRVSQCGGMAA